MRILPPLNSCFSSAPLLAITSGWTKPSLNSFAVNSSAALYSGVSYLNSSPPPAFLRQPPTVDPATPKNICTIEKTEPNAHTPFFASVAALPNE